jgi:hypothetical protein
MLDQMELVKETLEPQIVEQEFVQMPLHQTIQTYFVIPIELGVSQQGKVVWPQEVPVQVIQELQLVVLDLLDQTDSVKESMPLQVHHVPPRFVLRLQLLHRQMQLVHHIRLVAKPQEKDVSLP